MKQFIVEEAAQPPYCPNCFKAGQEIAALREALRVKDEALVAVKTELESFGKCLKFGPTEAGHGDGEPYCEEGTCFKIGEVWKDLLAQVLAALTPAPAPQKPCKHCGGKMDHLHSDKADPDEAPQKPEPPSWMPKCCQQEWLSDRKPEGERSASAELVYIAKAFVDCFDDDGAWRTLIPALREAVYAVWRAPASPKQEDK